LLEFGANAAVIVFHVQIQHDPDLKSVASLYYFWFEFEDNLPIATIYALKV
jgi:hypothetical protein